MKWFEKVISNRKIMFSKRHAHSAKSSETGVEHLVWREKSKSNEGPFPFINIERETVLVKKPHGRKIFRSTVIIPINGKMFSKLDMPEECSAKDNVFYVTCKSTIYTTTALFGTAKEQLSNKAEAHKLMNSSKLKLDGSIKKYGMKERSSVLAGTGNYGTRFIEALKTVDHIINSKPRSDAQNYPDEESFLLNCLLLKAFHKELYVAQDHP